MAEISAQSSRAARKTGAGMMDCKKALKETDGDMTKATEWLRQRASPPLIKKSRACGGRRTRGHIHTGGRVGVLVEVNCETTLWLVVRVSNASAQHRHANCGCPVSKDTFQTKSSRRKEIEMGRDDLATSQITSKKRLFRVD